MNFDILDQLPDGFLNVTSRGITELFPKPTLIHLPGQRSGPVFVSILLHGNEDVGLKAVQQVLKELGDRELPRSLSIFIGNVTAARLGVRRLFGQPDYNRVWPSTEHPPCPERDIMAAVVRDMQRRNVFVSLDLHNNTGANPLYSCVCDTGHQHLQLASLFSRTVVYFIRPRGVQTMAFSPICPAITCECGKVGDADGVIRAAELLSACLNIAEIPEHPVAEGDLHLFHTVATVKVPPTVTIGFGEDDADIVFPTDLDRANFCETGPGSEIATRRLGSDAMLIVQDELGRDCHDTYISCAGQSLRLKRRVLPSMLTLDERVIRQDCLCYFMERYEPAASSVR